jgi:hypothetical protein
MDLALRLEQLPEGAKSTSVKLGSVRTKLTQVHVWDYLATESEIMDVLREYGYGSEYKFARVMWHGKGGATVKTLSISTPLENEEGQSDLSKTLDCMLLLVGEVRRFTSVQNEGNEKLMTALLKSQDRNDELREQIVEERSTAVALDLALQQSESDSSQSFDYKEKALEAAMTLGQTYIASQSKITPDTLKNLVKNHPEIVDELLQDDEVVSIIGHRIMNRKIEKETISDVSPFIEESIEESEDAK